MSLFQYLLQSNYSSTPNHCIRVIYLPTLVMISNLILVLTASSALIGLLNGQQVAENEIQPEEGRPVENYVCPAGTLNAGWSVASSPAFADPSLCCGSRTEDWEIGSQYDTWYMETGCGLTYPLLRQNVYQYIFPIFCESNTDCGDYSMDGAAIECCSSGFCAAIGENGTSRCEEVTEMWTWDEEPDYGDNSDSEDYSPDPIDEYIAACEAKKSSICLGCSDNCADIGGLELWSAREDEENASSAPALRSLTSPGLGSAKKLIARRRLTRSKRALTRSGK